MLVTRVCYSRVRNIITQDASVAFQVASLVCRTTLEVEGVLGQVGAEQAVEGHVQHSVVIRECLHLQVSFGCQAIVKIESHPTPIFHVGYLNWIQIKT